MRLPRAPRYEDAVRGRAIARQARFLGPAAQLSVFVVLVVAVVLAWLDRHAVVTYLGLIAAALAVGLFIGGMFGPLVGRRRWLLDVAEGAAAAHALLQACPGGSAARVRPWEGPPGVAVPGIDEAIDTTLRLQGAAPFLLRPGERVWLRATTALLIHAEAGGPL